MMPHTNATGAHVLTKVFEMGVPQLARRHLNAHMMQPGITARVKMRQMQGDVKFLTQLLAKKLVPIRLFTAQAEIAMDGF